MSFQVKTEKVISRTAPDVFQAIKEGRLFLNCGADSEMKIDFRVGGQYKVTFKRYNAAHFGEFLEIVPDKKVVFSWCQEFSPDQKPDSTVTIELFSEGEKTKLVLVHTGFRTQSIADQHQGGWNGGLGDFSDEIQTGRIRMVRGLEAPVAKTFEFCQNASSLFASQGKILESVPNQKLMFAWPEGKVTLLFTEKDGNSTRLEMIHEGQSTQKNSISHRKGLEKATADAASHLEKGI